MKIEKFFVLELALLMTIILATPIIYAREKETTVSEMLHLSEDTSEQTPSDYDLGVEKGDVIILELTEQVRYNAPPDWPDYLDIGDEIKYEILGINVYEDDDGVEEKIEGIWLVLTTESGIYDEFNVRYDGSQIEELILHRGWADLEIKLNTTFTDFFGSRPTVYNSDFKITNGETFVVQFEYSFDLDNGNRTSYVLNEYDKSTGIRSKYIYNGSGFNVSNYWNNQYTLELKEFIKHSDNLFGSLDFPIFTLFVSILSIVLFRIKRRKV